MVDVIADVFLDDVSDGLLDFGCCSEELSSRYADGCPGFLESHELPELGFGREFYGSFVVSAASVFLSSEGACCLIVFMPEEFLHLGGDDDFSSLVVYGCVRQVRIEGDGVVGCPAVDGSSQLSCIDEDMPSWTRWTFSSLPSLGEESLSFEVLVELVGEVNLNVSEYVFYYFLNIFRHIVWRLRIFLYLCSVLSDYPLSMRGDWALSYRPIWLSSDSLFYCSIRFLNSL